jgi:sugar phosphate isomerase/epimerase
MATLTRRSVLAAACAGGAALSTPSASAAADSFSNRANADSKFRLGLVTYNLAANWDLPTLLQVCRSVGVTLVELRTGHKHGVEPTLSKEERQSVRKQFADAGVTCWGCGTTCEFHSPDAAVVRKNIDACKQFLELARDIGAHGVKVRPNGIPKGAAVEKTLQQIGAALAECGRAADEISGRNGGLEVWLEVHGPETAHPPYIKSIMESCGHASVGLTWNSNPTDIKDGSVAEYWNLLRPWVRSCHINELYKDCTGAYPYRELFRLMRQSGYDRVTECEVGMTPPDAASGSEILRYFKALWTELVRG